MRRSRWGTDWGAAHERYGSTLAPTSTQTELRTAICGLVNEMRSLHGNLTAAGSSCTWSSAPVYPAGYDAVLTAPALIEQGATPGARIQYAWIVPGYAGAPGQPASPTAHTMGYVRIPTFTGSGWGNDIDNALAALNGGTSLVIDVRGNSGGSETEAQLVAARFYDQSRVYRTAEFRNGPAHTDFGPAIELRVGPAGRHFPGRVALLADRGNHSAAEDFTMMMRLLPNVIVVGDTTFGTSSNPRIESLANGWSLRIPQTIQRTPGGFIVEGHGLPPAVAVRLVPGDGDTILRRAVRELLR